MPNIQFLWHTQSTAWSWGLPPTSIEEYSPSAKTNYPHTASHEPIICWTLLFGKKHQIIKLITIVRIKWKKMRKKTFPTIFCCLFCSPISRWIPRLAPVTAELSAATTEITRAKWWSEARVNLFVSVRRRVWKEKLLSWSFSRRIALNSGLRWVGLFWAELGCNYWNESNSE